MLVISGLAHLDVNQGVVLELQRAAGGPVSVREVARLPGAPRRLRQVNADTVVFDVLAGHDHAGKAVYLCQSYANNRVSSSELCKR